MPNQFTLPDVGEGLTEAEITAWRVSPGDPVALNQVVVEVETAKAVVELPSPYTGTVLELLHAVGDVVPVGSAIITIGEPVEQPDQPDEALARSGEREAAPTEPPVESTPAAAREPVLVGYGVRSIPAVRRPRRARTPQTVTAPRAGGAPLTTPPIRKFARSLSVELDKVTPSGARGRITRDDIRAAARGAVSIDRADLRIPIKGARKHIAEAMVRSAFTAPHVTEWLSVDITRSLKLIDKLRDAPDTRDLRITPLTLLARAAVLALARHPEINASWDPDADEIVQHRDVNLGIAVASPRGLIVPNIRRAQTLDFRALAASITELVVDARSNRTSVEAMRNGTFTITNIGVFGVDGATPILNPGESAILAFGQTRRIPWNHKNRVRLRSVTTLSLSFDHRLVDGELGSHVLADIAEVLEHPARALAH